MSCFFVTVGFKCGYKDVTMCLYGFFGVNLHELLPIERVLISNTGADIFLLILVFIFRTWFVCRNIMCQVGLNLHYAGECVLTMFFRIGRTR